MRSLCGLLVVLVAVAGIPAAAVAQQTGTVQGTVTDAATLQPLAGVQVSVQGTTLGSLTNAQGRFQIVNVPAGERVLRAQLIGYTRSSETVTIAAGATVSVNFSMAQTAVALEGVVVTATGEQVRRREVGNVVGTIDVADVELAAVGNFSQLVQGRVSGVTVIQSSGQAGAGSRIRIRGNNSISLMNSPLIVVDGVRVNDNPQSLYVWTGGQSPSRLDDLNPEDIENIAILKGPAAAALYGTAAANGVIQVTTRRGRPGQTVWRAYTEFADLDQRIIFPQNWYAEGRSATGSVVRCDYQQRATGACVQMDTIYRQTPLNDPQLSPFRNGNRRRYGVTLSGGSETATFYVSADREDETGVQLNNDAGSINLRANLTGQIRDNVRIGVNTGYTDRSITFPMNDNNSLSPLLNGMRGSPRPLFTNPDSPNFTGGYRSPFTMDMMTAWVPAQDLQRLTAGSNIAWQPLNWLTVTGVSGLDLVNRFDHSLVPPGPLEMFGGGFAVGFREQYRNQVFNYTGNLAVTGNRQLSNLMSSTTSVGAQYTQETSNWTGASGEGISPGTRLTAVPTEAFEGYQSNITVGAFAQQQFGFAERFFITGAVRGDQNSAFGQDLDWVWYPAVSSSWVISEEAFFPEQDYLSSLRLRASWGRSGLRPGLRDALRYYTGVSAAVEGQVMPGFVVAGAGHPGLRPEVSTETELGFDLGLFNDALGLVFAHYNKNSRDALVNRPLPPSFGATLGQWFNLGAVRNTGVEFELHARPVRTRLIDVDLRGTISTNRNELIDLGEVVPGEAMPPITFGPQRHVQGYPLGGYWLRPYTWQDVNGDGIIRADTFEVKLAPVTDVAYMGTPFPTREMAFSGNVRLGQLVRLSGLLDHKGGHKLLNWTAISRCAGTAGVCQERHDPNTPLERQAAIAALDLAGGSSLAGAGFLDDADFWRLRELSAAFSIPAQVAGRLGVRSDALQLTFAGRNLATWTRYGGFDPEVNSAGQANFSTDDFFTLPPVRHFTVRVDVNF